MEPNAAVVVVTPPSPGAPEMIEPEPEPDPDPDPDPEPDPEPLPEPEPAPFVGVDPLTPVAVEDGQMTSYVVLV